MDEGSPITVFGESEAETNCGSGTAIIGLELDIAGERVSFRIGVSEGQARLADIVPPARALSTKLVLAVLEKLRRDEELVPCCEGCSACCSYLTPLSVPEVFRLRQEILAMPTERGKKVFESCLDAAKKILDNRPEDSGVNELTEENGQIQVSGLGKWYAGLKQSCPFLSDGLCTVYEQRPIACREHMITGSASLCEAEWTDGSEVVRMPVSVLEALAQLTAELEQSSIEAVMLPLALPWACENIERDERRWPATVMAEQFAKIVKSMASKNSTAVVMSA